MIALRIRWRRHRARVLSWYSRLTIDAHFNGITVGSFKRGREVR